MLDNVLVSMDAGAWFPSISMLCKNQNYFWHCLLILMPHRERNNLQITVKIARHSNIYIAFHVVNLSSTICSHRPSFYREKQIVFGNDEVWVKLSLLTETFPIICQSPRWMGMALSMSMQSFDLEITWLDTNCIDLTPLGLDFSAIISCFHNSV